MNKPEMKKSVRLATKTVLPAAILFLLISFLFGSFSAVSAESVSDVARLVAEIDSLYTKLALANKDYETSKADLELLSVQADEAKALLDKTRKKLDRKRKAFNLRLVDMYKAGRTSGINIFFGSRDLMDFIDKSSWSERVAREDARLVGEIKITEAAVSQQERAMAEARRARQSRFYWASARKSELEAKLSDCWKKLSSIDPIVGKLMQQPQTELSHRINIYLAKKHSPLTGYGIVFDQAEKRTGVSARLLVGLTFAESSCATAGTWSRTNHNAWGMKGPQPSIADGIPASGGYCTWPDWETAIQQAADFIIHYWGKAQTAQQLAGYCETGGPGSDWEKRVEGSRNGI